VSDATRLAAPRPGEAGSGLAPKRISAAPSQHTVGGAYTSKASATNFERRISPSASDNCCPYGRTAGEFVLTLHAQQPLLQLVT
jgi:hypothetical protein